MAFVMVDASGENSIVVAPGANESLEARPPLGRCALLAPTDAVVTQAEIPGPACDPAIRAVDEAGCPAVVNLAPFRSVAQDVLALCGLLGVGPSHQRS
jgi:ribokinase